MNISQENLSTILIVLDDRKTQSSNDDIILLVLKILAYGVTPGICVFGVAGNILSIIILKRHGLHKKSNILLVSLAFSDLCYLIAFNNVPRLLYDIEGNGRFLFSKGVSYFLFIVYYLFTIFDYGMSSMGLTIPALITVERFIAVFFPLQMNTIITVARTWAVVIVLGVYCIGVMVYSCFWNTFEFSFDPEYNRSVGWRVRSDLFYQDWRFRDYMDLMYIGVKVQPLVTLMGCILIIFKVKMASNKRQKLAGKSNQSSVSKTTQTLMVVCVVYIIVCAIMFLPTLLPENILQFSLTSNTRTPLSLLMYQVLNIILCINSSWNFVIYIIFNKNFRDTYREIVAKYCSCA